MDVVGGLKTWLSFRSMVTPSILKTVYILIFIILNVIGVVALFGMPLMTVMGGFAADDSRGLMISIVVAILLFIVELIVLVIYNIFLRVYFEIIILMFNIYDELKAINDNIKKQ